jgi:hypothetical protein
MKVDKLEINLYIASFSMSRSIDDIFLVWEHLKYIRTGNDKHDREKDALAESIKYHADKLNEAKNALRASIPEWCKEE